MMAVSAISFEQKTAASPIPKALKIGACYHKNHALQGVYMKGTLTCHVRKHTTVHGHGYYKVVKCKLQWHKRNVCPPFHSTYLLLTTLI